MEKLPIEILDRIFYYLSFTDRKSLCLVCRRFYFTNQNKDLWENIVFVYTVNNCQSIREIYPDFLKKFTNLKFYSISLFPHQLSLVLEQCCHLKHLSINICFDLFDNVEEFERYFNDKSVNDEVRFSLNGLQSLNLKGNSQLTDVSLNCFLELSSQLNDLNLSELDFKSVDYTWKWPESTSNHQKSEIYRSIWCQVAPRNDKLTFGNMLVMLRQLSHSLTGLNLACTSLSEFEVLLLVNLPEVQLKYLNITNCKLLEVNSLKMILQRFQLSQFHLLKVNHSLIFTTKLFKTALFHLKSLQLRGAYTKQVEIFEGVSPEKIPLEKLHLEEFYIKNISFNMINSFTYLTDLIIIGCSFTVDSVLTNNNLTHLDLSRSFGFTTEFLQSIFLNLPKLKTLILDRVNFAGKWTEMNFSCSMNHLEQFSLIGAVNFPLGLVEQILNNCKGIKLLYIQEFSNLTDNFLYRITDACKHLIDLNLSGSNVTNTGVLNFLENCFNLRKLRLDNCQKLTDEFPMKLMGICPYLQQLSLKNCNMIQVAVDLSYCQGKFLKDVDIRSSENDSVK